MLFRSHHFYAFCWTNLLTRCPVPVPCFCCFCISGNHVCKYSRNWTKIYGDFLCEIRHMKTKGEPKGPPTGRRRPLPRPIGDPWVGPAPARGASPRPPPTPIKSLILSGRPLFPQKKSRRTVISNPSSGVILKQFPAPCRRGDRSRRALHRHAFLRDDL